MDHPVAPSRAEIIRHQSELGCWEYAIAKPHPSLYPHVRDRYHGWIEHMATPLCRREVPTEDVPVIINFGAPFRLFDQADPSRWGENVEAIHVYVADPDAHHARAAAAGARVTAPPFDTPWARGYYARDLDGFLWGFSTYKPAG